MVTKIGVLAVDAEAGLAVCAARQIVHDAFSRWLG
jgi:hypothetical protein